MKHESYAYCTNPTPLDWKVAMAFHFHENGKNTTRAAFMPYQFNIIDTWQISTMRPYETLMGYFALNAFPPSPVEWVSQVDSPVITASIKNEIPV